MTGPGRPSLCADAAGQRIDLASQALTATGVTLQIVRRNAGGPCQHDRLMHLAQMQADRGEHAAGVRISAAALERADGEGIALEKRDHG